MHDLLLLIRLHLLLWVVTEVVRWLLVLIEPIGSPGHICIVIDGDVLMMLLLQMLMLLLLLLLLIHILLAKSCKRVLFESLFFKAEISLLKGK